MKQHSRKKIFVKKTVQGLLAARCVVYWCSCLLTVFLFLFVAKVLSHQSASPAEVVESVYEHHGAIMLASLLLVPLVIWDMILFSHRVVGPLVRLEREMQKLADGKSVGPLQFRETDFWHGLAEQFNALRSRHLQLDHRAQVGTEDKQRDRSQDDPIEQEVARFPV